MYIWWMYTHKHSKIPYTTLHNIKPLTSSPWTPSLDNTAITELHQRQWLWTNSKRPKSKSMCRVSRATVANMGCASKISEKNMGSIPGGSVFKIPKRLVSPSILKLSLEPEDCVRPVVSICFPFWPFWDGWDSIIHDPHTDHLAHKVQVHPCDVPWSHWYFDRKTT